jgi:hypothetical protein
MKNISQMRATINSGYMGNANYSLHLKMHLIVVINLNDDGNNLVEENL